MIDTLIVGINGKMGKRLYEKAREYDLNVVCGIDKNPVGNFDCPVYKTFDEIKENVELIIDFSSPSSVKNLYKFANKNPCALLYGATGLNDAEKSKLMSLGNKMPVLITENTSKGVNLLLKLIEVLANQTKDCDIEIIEKHHRYKKDAPSGTAHLIKKKLSENFGSAEKNILVHSVRGGTIVGEHEVLFMFENEILSIKHHALSGNVFADGALKAAAMLYGKAAGVYETKDFFS